MFVSFTPLSVLLLSLFCTINAHQLEPQSPSYLPFLSARPAYARDVVGNWTFIYSDNDTLCPRSIQHRGFFRRNKGPIRIYHHRIFQDGMRCKNNRRFKGRRFRFFPSDVVRAAFKNRTTPYRVPRKLVRMLKVSAPTRNAFRSANKHGEDYLVGYESVSRRCGDDRTFRKGTTAFLFRPQKSTLSIKGVGVPLTPGKRYLVMVPLFKRISCVYSSELRPPDVNATATPTRDEDTSGAELEAKEDDAACFPAGASVRLADGRNVSMQDLSVNDYVQVGPKEYSPVFMFTHRMRRVVRKFLRIELSSGERLDVTSGHYVWANKKMVTAEQVKVGDVVPLANGSDARVMALDTVLGIGLYNPQTTHGDIIVNGVRVTTYTKALKPEIAHTMLTPLRAAFTFFNIDLSFGFFDHGANSLLSFGLIPR